jgi:hypothetical protein
LLSTIGAGSTSRASVGWAWGDTTFTGSGLSCSTWSLSLFPGSSFASVLSYSSSGRLLLIFTYADSYSSAFWGLTSLSLGIFSYIGSTFSFDGLS